MNGFLKLETAQIREGTFRYANLLKGRIPVFRCTSHERQLFGCPCYPFWNGLALAENIEQRAVRGVGAGAACDRSGENGFDHLEVADLRADDVEVVASNPFDLGASMATAIDERQQAADLFHGETKIPGAHHEVQPFHMRCSVTAMARRGARWIGHQADALVVADRLEIAAGQSREIGALQIARDGVIVRHEKTP